MPGAAIVTSPSRARSHARRMDLIAIALAVVVFAAMLAVIEMLERV
jgi:hypothetical protein